MLNFRQDIDALADAQHHNEAFEKCKQHLIGKFMGCSIYNLLEQDDQKTTDNALRCLFKRNWRTDVTKFRAWFAATTRK